MIWENLLLAAIVFLPVSMLGTMLTKTISQSFLFGTVSGVLVLVGLNLLGYPIFQ